MLLSLYRSSRRPGPLRHLRSDLHLSSPRPLSYGQYVAAQRVAENLKIEGGIDALKTLMTGDNAVSLGKAIEQLRPDLGKPAIDVEVKKAEAAAKKAEAEAKKGGKSNQ